MAKVPGVAKVEQAPSPGVASSGFDARKVAKAVQPSQTGGLIADLGADLSDAFTAMREEAFNENRIAAVNEASTNLPLRYDEEIANLENEAQPGANGFSRLAEERLDSTRKAFMQDLAGRYDLRESDLKVIDQRSKALAAPSLSAAARFEITERRRHFGEQLGSQIEGLALAARREPTAGRVELSLSSALQAIDNGKGILTPEQETLLKEQAQRSIHINAIEGMIEADPAGTLKRLDAGEFDSLTKQGLSAQDFESLETFAATKENKRIAEAGRLVTDAIFVLNRGRVPPNLAQVQAAAEGTRLAGDLEAAIQNRQAVASFTRQPLAAQAQQLRSIDRQGTATRSEVEKQEAMTRAFSGLATMVQQGNGLQAAAEAGAIDGVAELDFQDPDSLRARAVQSDVASRWAGSPVSPLLDAEADALAGAIDSASPSEVTQLMIGLHEGLGADGAGLVASTVAPKRPELAAAITLVPDDPRTARDIVQGGRLMRDNPDVVPGKADRVPAIEEVFGNMFTPESAGAMNAYVEAGTALYTARQLPTGNLTFDADAFEQALRDVAGNPVEINGRVILPPVPGMDEGAVEGLVEGLIQPDLIEFGNGVPMFADGSPFTVDLFDRGLFSTDAQLVTAGPGRYLVFMEGLGFVQSDAGGVYVLDLRAKVGR